MTNDKLPQKPLTRRKAVQLAGIGAVAAATWSSAALGQVTTARPAKSASKKAQLVNSVFLQCQPPTTDGAAKYHKGDSAIVFPLAAFWLLMVTEQWDNCLKDPAWFKNLVEELIATNGTLLDNEKKAFRAGTSLILEQLTKIQPQWDNVRSIFNQLVWGASAKYGTRPCPGGGTILDIAALTPHTRP